jgi:hypothetical protein
MAENHIRKFGYDDLSIIPSVPAIMEESLEMSPEAA